MTYEFPVSPAQARLLVLEGVNPGTAQYNVYAAFTVHGTFDVGAFRSAVAAVTARHEALRTVFRTSGGTLVQVVTDEPRHGFRQVDGVPVADIDRELAEEAARPFDLAVGPLLRAAVFGVRDGSSRVMLTSHHLVCDGWSMRIVLDDLSRFYRSALGPTAVDMPKPPSLQYPDYASWQRQRLAAGEYADQLAFWKEALRGAPAVLTLPADHRRPGMPGAAGTSETFTVDAEVAQAVSALARRCRASAFIVLLAAYAVFLARLAGQRDVVVGVPVAGRDRAELHDVVGMFSNTVALRVDLAGEPSFAEVVARTRDAVLDSTPFHEVPLETVVEALAPIRAPGRDPLFQTMFSHEDGPPLTLELPGARTEWTPFHLDVAKSDLTLYTDGTGDGLRARLEYRTDILTPATVRVWAASFPTLLTGLLADPEAPVDSVDALSTAERRRIVEDWNATGVATPAALVPDLVAERAAQHPDRTAVVCGEEVLSYQNLLSRADRLAVRLRRQGVGPEERVALLLPRSADMAVAILAVLRAGGAFLSLDPQAPPARTRRLLVDSAPRLVLAVGPTSALASESQAPVLLLDGPDVGSVADEAGPEPSAARRAGPGNAAYVLYTSGTTGTPKGVVVEHRALTNLATAVRDQIPVTPDDRVLQTVSFAFDGAVADVVCALTAGAELHIADESERFGDALYTRLRDSRITFAIFSTAAAATLPAPQHDMALRTLLVGGEAMPVDVVERWAPGRHLLNVYGPTECTVFATTAALRPGDDPVIGGPVANTRVYVLDDRLRPVPVGAVGEIYLAGSCVARGYLGRPGQTAERFVADPYGPAGTRMYRTGDLARYDAHGTITYVGRTDHQVKVRGFRIELGEIENVLAEHPEVATAVTVVADDPGGGTRLVAYAAGPDGRLPDPDAVLAWAREQLPGYMLPDTVVPLDRMPLTPSGKTDRAALPLPPVPRREVGRGPGSRPPRTEEERWIADVWAQVLRLDGVGVHDNFFDLGGTSMTLMAVQAALRPDADISLADLFRHPTVAALAGHLSTAARSAPAEEARTTGRARGTGRRGRAEHAAAHRAIRARNARQGRTD